MTDSDIIEKAIRSRYDECLDLYNKKEHEVVATFYTENATIMPPGQSPIVGRKAIVDACATLGAPCSVIEHEGTECFELLNDRTAYTTYLQAGKDEEGNKVVFYHLCILWKFVNEQWFIDREFYNVRPSPSSTEEDVKKQIQSRISGIIEAFNNDDFDSALDFYVEHPTLVPDGKHITKGKKAIAALFRTVIPPLKKLVVGEMSHFEMLNDVTVYTNSHVLSVDENGQVKTSVRDCLLWTLKDGEWFLERDMYHEEVPTTKK